MGKMFKKGIINYATGIALFLGILNFSSNAEAYSNRQHIKNIGKSSVKAVFSIPKGVLSIPKNVFDSLFENKKSELPKKIIPVDIKKDYVIFDTEFSLNSTGEALRNTLISVPKGILILGPRYAMDAYNYEKHPEFEENSNVPFGIYRMPFEQVKGSLEGCVNGVISMTNLASRVSEKTGVLGEFVKGPMRGVSETVQHVYDAVWNLISISGGD